MYPLSDEYMIFDNHSRRYILTEKCALEELGINLRVRVKNDIAIKRILKLASDRVYRFIYEHNIDNLVQDYIIAKTKGGRTIIKEAMEEQLMYLSMVGDMSKVQDVEKRALYIDDNAKSTLYRTIPEIGTTVCYTGNFGIMVTEKDF